MTERRDMIQDECLAWMKYHYPRVIVRGARGDNDLEVDDCAYPGNGFKWDRWDTI